MRSRDGVAASDGGAVLAFGESGEPALDPALRNCLGSCFPTLVLVGPQLIQHPNPACLKLFESSGEVAPGRPATESRLWLSLGPTLQEVYREGRSILKHIEVGRGFDARPFPWAASVSPLHQSDGSRAGVWVTLVESPLEQPVPNSQASAELEAVIESIPDAVWISDGKKIVRANSAALKAVGVFAVEQLQRRDFILRDQIHGRWADTGLPLTPDNDPFRNALRGKPMVAEVRVRPLGATRDHVMRFASGPIRREDKLIGSVTIGTDITARIEHHSELKASAERFRCLVLASSDLVWRAGADCASNPWEHTPGFTGFTGLPLKAGSPFGWLDAVHPDDREQVRNCQLRMSGNGDPCQTEFRLRRHDGAYRHLVSRGVPVLNDDGTVREWVGVAVDVTDRKNTEEQARRQAELEQQLVGIVSHDLGTPIFAIRASASLLAPACAGNPAHARLLDLMLNSANRAARMVRDLLDFTQARLGGGLRLYRRELDFHRLVAEAAAEVRAAIPGRTLSLQPEGVARGEVDSDRIAQVVTNLINNALLYSPPESTVTITTGEQAGALFLRVHNWGAEIPPDRRELLFQPMQRGRHPGGVNSGGVGLGLYIVDQVVRSHGGSVEVRSNSLEGTTFTVHLPCLPRDEEEEPLIV